MEIWRVANDYQASTSAVRMLELRDVRTQLSGCHLGRYGGVACNREKVWRYFLQTSHTKTHTCVYSGVWCSEKALTGSLETWALFQTCCQLTDFW